MWYLIARNGVIPRYRLLPRLFQEFIIDQAIASIELTPVEIASYQSRIEQQPTSQFPTGDRTLADTLLSPPPDNSLRQYRLEKFKQLTWNRQIESYFLKRKKQLDAAVYSLIRTREEGLVHELYFRLEEGEQTFAELAPLYSQGGEAKTQGLVGPVEMGRLHPTVAQFLQNSQPGQLFAPVHLGEWWLIIKLEQWLPAQLDSTMHQRLLNELFEQWLQEQLQQVINQSHLTLETFLVPQFQHGFNVQMINS
uniref:peptidylprolyl isomerase n=1 Tax=Cyanothece sp. (strain PCC 7425 / ATCC 29141) TaxID=395961 RepID=B8HZ92_CYAP4